MKYIYVILLLLILGSNLYAESAIKRPGAYTNGFHYSEDIASGGTGVTLSMPPMPDKKVTVRLTCGTGVGKVQVTLSSDDEVTAGTAVWTDWPLGEVTGTRVDVIEGPITGLRAVSVDGVVKLEVVY